MHPNRPLSPPPDPTSSTTMVFCLISMALLIGWWINKTDSDLRLTHEQLLLERRRRLDAEQNQRVHEDQMDGALDTITELKARVEHLEANGPGE